MQSLVVSLVLARLAYGNTSLADLPNTLLNRLQSVQHTAAHLIYSARKHDHISPLLIDLHWLRVPQQIEFKLVVVVYRCLRGTAPPYLADELCPVAGMPASVILINGNTQRSSGAQFYHGRSLFLCGCCTRLEQFAFRHYLGHVTVAFQTGVEDRAVLLQLF